MSEGSKRRVVLGPDSVEERALDPQAAIEDEFFGATLRPRSFDEYVGQTTVVDNLKIAIDAARRRDEPLEHILFYGPPGLGKTTLAALIAKDLGRSLRPTSGPTLEKPKDLVGILTSLETGDLLFIDEIHRLGGVVEEFLYPAMEDFRIDIVMDRGAYAKTFKLPLAQFTLVGATTRAGMLSAPLRERFGISYHLDYYADEELERIVTRSAGVLGIPIDADGAATIARRSRGTPRIANRLLRRVRDYAEVRADGTITRPVAEEALRREGVDEIGLDRLDAGGIRTPRAAHGNGGRATALALAELRAAALVLRAVALAASRGHERPRASGAAAAAPAGTAVVSHGRVRVTTTSSSRHVSVIRCSASMSARVWRAPTRAVMKASIAVAAHRARSNTAPPASVRVVSRHRLFARGERWMKPACSRRPMIAIIACGDTKLRRASSALVTLALLAIAFKARNCGVERPTRPKAWSSADFAVVCALRSA